MTFRSRFFIGTALFCCLVLSHAASGDDLVPDSKQILIEGDDLKPQISGTVGIKNVSAKAIDIKKIKTSCGCTAATAQKSTLSPGESTDIQINVDTAKVRGTKELFVIVSTDSTETPLLPIAVIATIHNKIEITPPNFTWKQGEVDAKSVQITIADEISLKIDRAIPASDYFAPSISTIKEGSVYQVTVTPSSKAPNGKSVIRLLTDSAEIPFLIVPVEVK